MKQFSSVTLVACIAVLFATSVLAQPANIGKFEILEVKQMVTCIHSMLLPGPESPAPGKRPKLLCVERPHGGGKGKYPPNPNAEPDNSRTNAAEVDLFAPPGTLPSAYAKMSKAINNPFCSGHAQMADGSIIVAGGDREGFVDPTGNALLIDGTNIKRVYTPLDSPNPPATGPWAAAGAAMAKGRWYPTVHTLADKSQIIVGGVAVALDLDAYSRGERNLNPTYEFNPSKGPAVDLKILADNDPWNLYPIVQQMPISGDVWIFSGGPSVLLNPNTGAVKYLADMTDTTHHPRIYPFTPTFVMLPLRESNGWKATILLCGGTLRDAGVTNTTITSTGKASNYCSKFSPEDPDGKWDENFVQWAGMGKVMPDAVLMPDGKVLFVNGAQWGSAGGDAGVINGGHPPNFNSHVYDPTTQKFTQGPDDPVARLYHSGALLLPDGRIITTGSEMANWQDIEGTPNKVLTGLCFPGITPGFTSADNDPTANCTDPFEYRVSLYTPAYYSLSGKPVISEGYGTSYPKSTTYGSNFIVKFDTPATEVASISFIRYSTTTHSNNPDQRFVELPIKFANQSILIIDAPINGTIAPPGNWMLFPVAKNGAVGHSVTIRMEPGEVKRVEIPVIATTTTGTTQPTGPSNSKSGAGALGAGLSYIVVCVLFMSSFLI